MTLVIVILTLEDKTFKNKELELKNKLEKVRNFNPKTCYEFSELNENDLDNTYTPNDSSAPSKTPNLEDISLIRDRPKILLDSQVISNKNITTKRIFHFKNLIKWIDISVCFLIIIGCLISQYENESYYQDNKNDRIGVVKLIRERKTNITDIDFSKFNISYYNTEVWKNLNLTDYYHIPILFQISSTGNILRYCILIFTIMCIPLIIISRYVEYLRDCIYKQKLESK
jgi:hypothetical protein